MLDTATSDHANREQAPEVGNDQGCGCLPGARWYAVETNGGAERQARDGIEALGMGAFLPMVTERRRGVAVLVPCFPRYVLARFSATAHNWPALYRTRGVRGILSHGYGKPTPIADEAVHALLALGYDRPIADDPTPALIQAGAAVQITGGPFAGHDGVCLWSNAQRVRLLLSLFGGRREVEVKRAQVV
jgi:transcription antitermination factor NusG